MNNIKERIRCYAYTDFIENAFSSDKKEVRVDDADYPYNRYYIDYESDYKRDNNYLYGIIIDFTYDGVDYSIHDESWRYSENTYSVFLYQGEDLDLNKLTINKLTMTYSERYHSHVGDVIMGILIFIAVCFAIVVSGGIFCIIFFSIRKAKRRKALMNS